MNMMSKWLVWLALLLGPVLASAQSVTYQYTGIVTGATGVYASTAGTSVAGTFTINVGAGVGTLPVSFTSPWSSNSAGSSTRVVASTLESGSVIFNDAGGNGNITGVGGAAPSGSTVPNEYFAIDQEFSNEQAFVRNGFQLFGGTGPNAPFDAKGLPVFGNATGGAYGTLLDYLGGGEYGGKLSYKIIFFTPSTPSLSGTAIPSAPRIVDTYLNVWTLSRGVAYKNGKPTVSSGVILILCYGGIVYQENSHHLWWLWDINTNAWAASIDPRVISPSGTTVPVATQIIDSELDVWTLSGAQAYENGQLTPSSEVIRLLYAKGMVYQENSNHLWWYFRNGAWEATSAPLTPSESGTAIPNATQIVDNGRNVWTLSGGKAYENHALTPSSDVTLLLFYGGTIYQENVHHYWWEWNGKAWISTASDPRVGQPLAYVASQTAGGGYSVTVVDTGTNLVKATIPISFEASYMVVTPDAEHVYVAGSSNNSYGSVAVIDTAQESVVASIQLPSMPVSTGGVAGIAASPDGKKVYVVSTASFPPNGSSIVSTIDTATNVLVANLALPEFDTSISISPDGKKLYLAAGDICFCGEPYTAEFIDVIDTASNTLVSQFGFQTPEWGAIENAVISPNNAKLYSNHSSYAWVDQQVAVLDPSTGVETATIPAVLTVQVFSPDSRHLYGVSVGWGLGGVGVIDTVTDISTTAVANIPGASGLAITPDGKHLYITDVNTNSVLVADTATYTVSSVIPVSLAGSGAIAIVSAQ